MMHKRRCYRLTAGQLLLVTTGEYDTYGTEAVVRLCRDADMVVLLREFLVAHPSQKTSFGFRAEAFLAWLVAHGVIMGEPYEELYLKDWDLPEWYGG